MVNLGRSVEKIRIAFGKKPDENGNRAIIDNRGKKVCINQG